MAAEILVVEDNPSNLELLTFLLEHQGYRVLQAKDGREGLEKARLHKPSLVLMDIQMPVMDGMKAMKAIKSDPGTKDIKVIAVTSFAMKGDREKALAAGFDGYLAKPIDTQAFAEFIRSCLAR